MVDTFYDVDSYVYEAIKQRDFEVARGYVYRYGGILSVRDRKLLLRAIANEEAKFQPMS